MGATYVFKKCIQCGSNPICREIIKDLQRKHSGKYIIVDECYRIISIWIIVDNNLELIYTLTKVNLVHLFHMNVDSRDVLVTTGDTVIL